jgi:hypothetical protein
MPTLNVLVEGREIQDGIYELKQYKEGSDYYDPVKNRWIGSIGQRFSDDKIFASCDVRFADNPNYSCLFMR